MANVQLQFSRQFYIRPGYQYRSNNGQIIIQDENFLSFLLYFSVAKTLKIQRKISRKEEKSFGTRILFQGNMAGGKRFRSSHQCYHIYLTALLKQFLPATLETVSYKTSTAVTLVQAKQANHMT